jgi:hypothetical protein
VRVEEADEVGLAAAALGADDRDEGAAGGGAPARNAGKDRDERCPALPPEALVGVPAGEGTQAEERRGLPGEGPRGPLPVRAEARGDRFRDLEPDGGELEESDDVLPRRPDVEVEILLRELLQVATEER